MVSSRTSITARLRLWHPERLAGWGIVLLAGVLRLSCLDLVEFKADEAQHLLRGLEVLQLRLPLVGSQASVGVAKPPMMSLLMAIPLLLGRDPRVASGFIALLNVFAVAGCYLLACRYYNRRVALSAATLFAVNPWAVVLSRKVFTADVLAPFLVLYLYALHAALVDGRPWGWFLAALALGIALNITFSPLPLLFVLFLAVIIYRRRVRWGHLLLGVLVGLLLFAPYLYAQTRHIEEIKGLLRSATQKGFKVGHVAQTLRYALYLHSGYNLGALAGASFPSFAPAHSWLRHLNGLAGALFILSLPVITALALRARSRGGERGQGATYTLLALWLLVSLGVVALQGVVQDMHYLVILYPAGFLAMGLTVDLLWGALGARFAGRLGWVRSLRFVIGAGLACLVAWQAYTVFYLYRFVAQEDTGGGYGVPLRYWQSVSRLVRREAASAGVRAVWIITQGTSIEYEELPAILHYLLGPDLEAVFMGQGGNDCLLLPVGSPAVYLFTRPLSERIERLIVQLGGEEKGSLAAPGGQACARVVVVPARSWEEVLGSARQLVPPKRLDVGLALLGYQWPAEAHPGDTVSLATYWSFGDIPAMERNVGHSLFNHLLDAQGNKIAQRDGFGLPERYWRKGLMLVQWFDLELPPETPEGDYTLITGMYRLSDLSRCQVLDEGNVAVGDHISLGAIHVAP
jgi:4-amino-4-deoxy-L-arabinose transferase-like glycosyltransferase